MAVPACVHVMVAVPEGRSGAHPCNPRKSGYRPPAARSSRMRTGDDGHGPVRKSQVRHDDRTSWLIPGRPTGCYGQPDRSAASTPRGNPRRVDR
jgi:hypothetical protein